MDFDFSGLARDCLKLLGKYVLILAVGIVAAVAVGRVLL